MRIYILRRLLGIVPTVLMITLVVFVMMRSIPGDPVVALLGDAYTEEDAVKVARGLRPEQARHGPVPDLARQAGPGGLGHFDPQRAARAPGRAVPSARDPGADRALHGGGAGDRHSRGDHRRHAPEHLGRLLGDVGGHDRRVHPGVLPGRAAPARLLGGAEGGAAQLGLGLLARHLHERGLRGRPVWATSSTC